MQIKDYIEIVDQKLDEYIPITYPEDIFKSMRYTVLLPGKRLRPIMCIESAKLFGAKLEDTLPTACAIEMLHAQTLIHDDLPCMDNDDFRRGKPSNHKVFPEAISVLAGDALLTFAPQVILNNSKNLDYEKLIKVLNEYFYAAGAYGVIAGQVVDIENERKQNKGSELSQNQKAEILNYLHLHKTGDLFRLSLRAGAIIGGADEKSLEALTIFAEKFGIAFQIADDILDEEATFSEIGKTPGKDKEAGKLTYTTLYGIQKAKEDLSKLITECRKILTDNNFNSEIFEEILNKISKQTY